MNKILKPNKLENHVCAEKSSYISEKELSKCHPRRSFCCFWQDNLRRKWVVVTFIGLHYQTHRGFDMHWSTCLWFVWSVKIGRKKLFLMRWSDLRQRNDRIKLAIFTLQFFTHFNFLSFIQSMNASRLHSFEMSKLKHWPSTAGAIIYTHFILPCTAFHPHQGGYLQNLRQLSPLLTSNLSCIFIYRICVFFLNNPRHFQPKKFAAKIEVNSVEPKCNSYKIRVKSSIL